MGNGSGCLSIGRIGLGIVRRGLSIVRRGLRNVRKNVGVENEIF
jgi:hypothetical protein